MPTGKRLLRNCMPHRFKQGTLYPVGGYSYEYDKPYGNRKARKAGHVRKAGQNKVRKQLKKELDEMLIENDQID